jgi:outer membrane protein assembly factor BamB
MIMKKFTYLFVFYLLMAGCASIPNAIHSYSELVSVEAVKTEIRNDFNPGAAITATEYKFPFVVRDVVVDTLEMKALVRLIKPDEKPAKVPSILVYYDLVENNVLWTKRSYAWWPEFLDDKIIITNYSKTFALNKKTGEMVWERAGGYGYINKEKNIALTGYLTAIDLKTGIDKWHREVESRFGWEEIKPDGESLIAAIDGLHTFDVQTGTGWDIEMSTGKKGEVAAAVKTVGIYALAALGGYVATGSVKANEFTGMTSNILVSGDQIFFAAKDNLVCVEKGTGKEIWRAELPDKKTANSVLLEDGNHIFFANKSYCFKNNEFHRYGIPYISKFDKTTGEQLFSEDLDAKFYIQDVQLTSNGYYLITENELLHFGSDGKLNLKLEMTEDNEKYGNNLELLTENYPFDKYFVQQNQTFVPLTNYLVAPAVPAIETENGILILDADLNIHQYLPSEEVFFIATENNQTKLLRSSRYISLTDELNFLDMKINSGLTPLYQLKSFKRNYNQLREDNQDILRNVFLVDQNGNTKGRMGIPEFIVPTKNHFYFTSENGLTLVSKTEIK